MGIDMQQPAVPMSVTITIISHDGGLNKTMVYPNVYDFDMSQQPLEQYFAMDPELSIIPPRLSLGSAFGLDFKARADANGVHTIVSNNLISKPDLDLLVPGFKPNDLLRMAADYVEKTVARKEALLRELMDFGDETLIEYIRAQGYDVQAPSEDEDDEENYE